MSAPNSGPAAPRIVRMPENVKNQIAAGEVVERPASVVKELVENSLDAGATEIRVDLEEGGVKLVRITDDGCGMGALDLALAFCPHATSKLRSVDDLEHIASLGFRGEALASIGAVSRTIILSRLEGDETGMRIENDWGQIGEPTQAGAPRGTSIEVRELFLKLPARRRFLKRTSTELGRCLDILQRLAIAHEGVGFVVTHDKKRVLDVEAKMNRRERVHRLFGAELANELVEVYGEDGSTQLSGLVAPPRFGRSDTTRQMWFLNGRALKDKVLLRVLKQAYRGLAIDIKQPVAFLNLNMDPSLVDVNVHPTKSEVRFRDDRRLFGFLVNTLRSGLAKTDMSTPGEKMFDVLERRQARAGGGQHQAELPDPGPGIASSDQPLSVYEVPGRPMEPMGDAAPPAPETATGIQAAARSAGAWDAPDTLEGPYLRVAKTYVLRSFPGGFEIVDQHALHERITFEKLKRQLGESGVEVQCLLVPELVEVTRVEMGLFEANLESLSGIGVQLQAFGETTIAVHGVPALLRRVNYEQFVRELLLMLKRLGQTPAAQELLEEVLHSMACRSSVMAGDELSDADIQGLLRSAEEAGGAQTCPHGRPTRVRFGLHDLEKAFHRK